MDIVNTRWILCPICGNKTRLKMREDTELKNFPLFCPKCRQEILIEITKFRITVITEPDAKTQSR
ncbi:cysteine-rich KTR domain-containing protein [Enterococcus faecium]